MSLLKEISATFLDAETIVAETVVSPPTVAISQLLTANTVITLPENAASGNSKINVLFTNAIPITQPVTISISNAQSAAVLGTELVLYFTFVIDPLAPNDTSLVTLSSDFFYIACGAVETNITVTAQYFVIRFLFNGTVFVNTSDTC